MIIDFEGLTAAGKTTLSKLTSDLLSIPYFCMVTVPESPASRYYKSLKADGVIGWRTSDCLHVLERLASIKVMEDAWEGFPEVVTECFWQVLAWENRLNYLRVVEGC